MRPLPEIENKLGSAVPRSATGSPSSPGTPSHPGDPSTAQTSTSSLPDWQRYCPQAASNVVAGQNEMNAEYQLPPNGYQCLPLQRYPLEAASADAIYYNALFSLDQRLEKIQV